MWLCSSMPLCFFYIVFCWSCHLKGFEKVLAYLNWHFPHGKISSNNWRLDLTEQHNWGSLSEYQQCTDNILPLCCRSICQSSWCICVHICGSSADLPTQVCLLGFRDFTTSICQTRFSYLDLFCVIPDFSKAANSHYNGGGLWYKQFEKKKI